MPLKNIKYGRIVFVKIKYDPWWPAIVKSFFIIQKKIFYTKKKNF